MNIKLMNSLVNVILTAIWIHTKVDLILHFYQVMTSLGIGEKSVITSGDNGLNLIGWLITNSKSKNKINNQLNDYLYTHYPR